MTGRPRAPTMARRQRVRRVARCPRYRRPARLQVGPAWAGVEDRHEDLRRVHGQLRLLIEQDMDLAPLLKGAARRLLSVPALGVRAQGPDHGALWRPSGGPRGGRCVLHVSGACTSGGGRDRVRAVQPSVRAALRPGGDDEQRLARSRGQRALIGAGGGAAVPLPSSLGESMGWVTLLKEAIRGRV